MREVAMLASAPTPASIADQSRRLTASLSPIGAAVNQRWAPEGRGASASRPSQMVSTT
jgi:hypothetical protein